MHKTIQDWLVNPRSGTLSNFRVGYFAGARLLLPEEQEEWIEDMVIVGPREKGGKAKAPAGGPRVKGCKAKAPAVLSGEPGPNRSKGFGAEPQKQSQNRKRTVAPTANIIQMILSYRTRPGKAAARPRHRNRLVAPGRTESLAGKTTRHNR